ncbi:MAG: Fe-S cluster assembly scaffold protein NifU [Elusimicrobiota bacterium]|nr:Fe-S cluster assembly scaffold protein NifU [Elusimicrobiota bacterium]
MYSDKVMDHFINPRNVGEIKNPDGVGRLGNPACGDIMEFHIKVKDDRLEDVKFKTFGCGAAISVSSMISELAIGKTLDEAMAIKNSDIAEELGGLPKNKLHCSNLGADALHLAIEDYRKKEAGKKEGAEESMDEARPESECTCKYCDKNIPEEETVCPFCEKEVDK